METEKSQSNDHDADNQCTASYYHHQQHWSHRYTQWMLLIIIHT